MTFDPFKDFAEKGYLRNHLAEKDLEQVKLAERISVKDHLEEVFEYLHQQDYIQYRDVLKAHKILFQDVYPWAGQDRAETTPNISVSKAHVVFAAPSEARRSTEYALQLGQDPSTMAAKPGEIMGYFAYAHPFLDGNGRTIMAVHTELAFRAGVSIKWQSTKKDDYLKALTAELDEPNKGHLDRYLKSFVEKVLERGRLTDHLQQIPGLNSASIADEGVIAESLSDPAVQARYQAVEHKREQADPNYAEWKRNYNVAVPKPAPSARADPG